MTRRLYNRVVDSAVIDSTDAAVTISEYHTVFDGFTNGRNVTLPSTDIVKGQEFILENQTTQTMTVLASNASELTIANGCRTGATIARGRVQVRALQDTPTDPSHWYVISAKEETTKLLDNEFTGGELTAYINREDNRVTIQTRGTTSHPSFSRAETSSGWIPTRFRPTSPFRTVGMISVIAEMVEVNPNGIYVIRYYTEALVGANRTATSDSWGIEYTLTP